MVLVLVLDGSVSVEAVSSVEALVLMNKVSVDAALEVSLPHGVRCPNRDVNAEPGFFERSDLHMPSDGLTDGGCGMNGD